MLNIRITKKECIYTNQTIIIAWKITVSKREITEPLLFHSDYGMLFFKLKGTFRIFFEYNISIEFLSCLACHSFDK